ncbi:flagellar hook-associated protein FlgL [Noviherbaspirillum sp. ST9]|uniref:flagellar hook-associated protein FlgL n=1 Tax=Noviherbaspirillum sp. ST9 TaxID=3401606 RepID=UPI003B589CEB
MRISTNTIYDNGVARMGELQTGLSKTQQQVSTGKRLITPSDDPVASARALEVTNSQEINAKFAINRRSAMDALSMTEGALQGVTHTLQDIKTLIVQAGNGALTNSDRQFIATELQGRFDELLGLANTRDGVGNFIFAGYQNTTEPFAASATGASYSGDQGQFKLQVHNGRQLEVNQNGSEVFQQIGSSKTFSTGLGTPATGSISKATVFDADQVTGSGYNITLDATGTNYTITTNATPAVTVATAPYTSGQAIQVEGLEVTITGASANSVYTVRPTTTQSVFTTIKELIGVLQTPVSSAADKTKYNSGLSIANGNIDKALDHVLTARAGIGASMKEVESLDNLGADLNIQYAKTLSDLQDLDYVTAITDLMKQQTALQASQQSFMKVTSLSLFDFLR